MSGRPPHAIRDATPPTSGHRGSFTHDGLRLSYLDFGGDDGRPVLLALHGHLNEGRFVEQGAVPLDIGYRIVAPDQRGHGESDHPDAYSPDGYVGDALALLDHLGVERATMLGHSLGGQVAYRLAAAAPDRVDALVVVEMGAVLRSGSMEIIGGFPRRAATREALIEAFSFLGPNHAYVMREYADGWGVPWEVPEMLASEASISGDHWDVWLATDMPALVVHGTDSNVLDTQHADEMAARRSATEVVHIAGGHGIYRAAPREYTGAVTAFLDRGSLD